MPQAVVAVALSLASYAYQRNKQKKLQAQINAQRDEMLGVELVVSGQPEYLIVPYGRNKLGGIRTLHRTSTSHNSTNFSGKPIDRWFFRHNGPGNTGVGVPTNFALFPSISGTKNEFLFVQQVISVGGINYIVDAEVNGVPWTDPAYWFGQWITVKYDSDNLDHAYATANGIATSNKFTNCASATMAFRLNREDYNYNGVPDVTFYVQGIKVRWVIDNLNGTYSLSSGRAYSNNPALCLLDYLTSTKYGMGLTEEDLDLRSFYEAAQVCNTIVKSNAAIGGKIHGGITTRNIPLYECNIALSTENTIRENIESILETMGQADLVWSAGKYRLNLKYPTSQEQEDSLIHPNHFFNEDNIIDDEINIIFPNAQERLNQVTVNFRNEHNDFKLDSVTWPKTGSVPYTTYLNEDGGRYLQRDFSFPGITDPYHALAKAEQLVRQSRNTFIVEFRSSIKGLSVEPGDFINVDIPSRGIELETFKVQSVSIQEDLSCKIVAVRFNYEELAWNIDDDIPYGDKFVPDFSLVAPTLGTITVQYIKLADKSYSSQITVPWSSPSDSSVVSYEFQWKLSTNPVFSEAVSIPLIATGNSYVVRDLAPGLTYDFRVRGRAKDGRVTNWVQTSFLVSSPSAPPVTPSGWVGEAKETGIVLRGNPPPDSDFDYFEIWYYTAGGNSPLLLARTTDNYYFRAVSPGDTRNTYRIRSVDIFGNTSGWTNYITVFPTGIQVTNLSVADGLEFIQIRDTLPPNNDGGNVVYLTTDDKLYRWNSFTNSWQREIPTSDLIGTITNTQIANDAITAPKIKAGEITGDKIAGNTITGNKIAADAIVAGSAIIAAGAITEAKIGTGAVTNLKIGNEISSNNFVTGVSGWRILKNGNAEFNGVVISRPLLVASGIHNTGQVGINTNGNNGMTWNPLAFQVTGLPLTAWEGINVSYIAEAGFYNGPSDNPLDTKVFADQVDVDANNVWWGIRTQILPVTRWFGPDALSLRFQVFTWNVNSITTRGGPPNTIHITWRVYKVT
jgi:hypothetical protein